jgi:hypothetical protein
MSRRWTHFSINRIRSYVPPPPKNKILTGGRDLFNELATSAEEAQTRSETEPQFKMMELKAHELSVYSVSSRRPEQRG